MTGKRSQVDRSKIDRGSDLGQRIETTVELERSKQEQLFKQSIVSFRQGFMRQPWRIYGWLGLTIAISVITLPFINRLVTTSLDIPRIICLAIILLVSEGISFIRRQKFFNDRLRRREPWLLWTFYPLRACVAIALVVYSFISLPHLILLVTNSLGISFWLSAMIVLLCFVSIFFLDRYRINNYVLYAFCLPIYTVICILEALYIPLYIVFEHEKRLIYQPWLWWWLKNYWRKSSSASEQIQDGKPKYLGINIVGGLVPIAIAFWQFTRVAVSPIFLVTAVTTACCYFMVEVDNDGIHPRKYQVWIIAVAISILTILIAEPNSKMAIAYAGITLGSLIGADLLHLPDLRPEQTDYGMSIGGAGSKDGIALSGLYVILTIELWEQVVSLISSS